MSDRVMLEAGEGITEHLEDLLLNSEDERAEDLIASCLVVVLSILKPLNEQTLATTSGRHKKSPEPVDELYHPK
jgi:hypothetical protein